MIGVEGNTVPSVEKLYTINAEDVKNGNIYQKIIKSFPDAELIDVELKDDEQ